MEENMGNVKLWLGLILMVFVIGMDVFGDDTNNDITASDLVGVWVLYDAINTPFQELITKTELFEDGTGIMHHSDPNLSPISIRWSLINGSRLRTIMFPFTIVDDIELAEDGALLIFHYSGRYYSGEHPEIGIYRRR